MSQKSNIEIGLDVVKTAVGMYAGYQALKYFGVIGKKDTGGGGDNSPPKDYNLPNAETVTGWQLEAIADDKAVALGSGVVMRKQPKSNADWARSSAYKKNEPLGYVYSVLEEKLPNNQDPTKPRIKVWVNMTSTPSGKSLGWVPLTEVGILKKNWAGVTYVISAQKEIENYFKDK